LLLKVISSKTKPFLLKQSLNKKLKKYKPKNYKLNKKPEDKKIKKEEKKEQIKFKDFD
jgi:hypothetical protein